MKPKKCPKERMRRIVKDMQEYIDTYSSQRGYERHSDETFVNDMLYGIGISINKQDFGFAGGFRRFKEKLKKEYLQ